MRAKHELTFTDKYKLSTDPLNIILQEKRVITETGKKKPTKREIGDTYWTNIAYFSSAQNALKYVIEKEIRESWVDDLKEVVKKVTALEKKIDGLSHKVLPQTVQ